MRTLVARYPQEPLLVSCAGVFDAPAFVTARFGKHIPGNIL